MPFDPPTIHSPQPNLGRGRSTAIIDLMPRPLLAFGAVLVVLLAAGPGVASTSVAQSASAKELCVQAQELAYNLDHDQAMEVLRRALAQYPNEPGPHRTMAAILWHHMLFLRGAVTVDHYLGSITRARVDLKKPPPDIDAAFKKHVRKAIELAEARTRSNPKDAQAHYDLGSALGLEASYIATVEGRMVAGFKAARRSYDEHEQVLELDGNRLDAGLVVGTYRYVVSTLSLPMRMMAYVAGFGGGKERGIAMLQKASQSSEARADALFALILVFNREKRYDEASQVLRQLRGFYPRNRLVVLEAGSTALRAKRFAEADALLTEGLGILARDTRQRIPGEESLWRYKRGSARAALGRSDAADDLRAATAGDAQAWVAGRARLELGQLALKRGDKSAADAEATQAETLCTTGNDPTCVDEARKLGKNARGR